MFKRFATYAAIGALLAPINLCAFLALAQVGGGIANGGGQSGVLGTSGAQPTISACGTGPQAPSALQNAYGTIIEGSTATGCVITFSSARNGTPSCNVTARSNSTVPVLTYFTTTTALTWTNASASGAVFDYICSGT